MTDLAASGTIDLKVAEQFESVRARAAALLDAADAAVASGEDFSFADLESTLESLQSIVSLALQAVQS